MRTLVEQPDEVQDHFSDYCKECGQDISDVDSVLEYTTQEIDMPSVRPIYRAHRHCMKVCSCGCKNRSYEPRKRGGNGITFGKNIQALVVYLNVVQCIAYERLKSFLESIFAIEMSQGTIYNIIQTAKKKAEPTIELIKEYISNSKVVGFDESGCYCNGRLDWSWIAQTAYYTLVFRANGRAGKSLEKMTAVTDRHSAYFALNFINHQICLAHILRQVQYLNELNTNQMWSGDLLKLLQESIHLRNEEPGKVFDISPWLERLDRLLKINLNHLDAKF